VFIADKGFCSEANIEALEEEVLKYLIPLLITGRLGRAVLRET
jgi:transposase